MSRKDEREKKELVSIYTTYEFRMVVEELGGGFWGGGGGEIAKWCWSGLFGSFFFFFKNHKQ